MAGEYGSDYFEEILMKGFIVFELAPPFQLKPKYENGGPIRRVIWLWFSITVAFGITWTEFVRRLIKFNSTESQNNDDDSDGPLWI
jgi:hypothetical protein